MERTSWTDERLDELAARSESQFELLRGDMRDLRAEIRELRTDMHLEITSVRRDMFHGVIALFGSQVAVFAVLLAQAL